MLLFPLTSQFFSENNNIESKNVNILSQKSANAITCKSEKKRKYPVQIFNLLIDTLPSNACRLLFTKGLRYIAPGTKV